MRILIFLTSLMLLPSLCNGQIDWKAYSQTSFDETGSKPTSLGLIVCITKDNNSFWDQGSDSSYFSTLFRDSAFLSQRVGHVIARTTFDTAAVQFFMHGVDNKNADEYQFRVLEYPNRVVEPWQSFQHFTTRASSKINGLPEMGYVGGYQAKLSNILIVDVRRTSDNKVISSAAVASLPVRPIVTNVYTSDTFDDFFQRLQYPWSNQASRNVGRISREIKSSSGNTNFIFFLKAEIYHRRQVQYQLMRDDDVIVPWKENDYDNSFIWLKESRPGTYILKIRYAVQPRHISIYKFYVAPAWYQTTAFRIVAGTLLLAITGLVIFIILLIRQRRITFRERTNKSRLQLELKSIHAQLNPHFVFNALSSIQGLINAKDIHGANTYLSDFAKLMRESLRSGQQDDLPLAGEIAFLNTYLKLEQLRFGFAYQINVDPLINSYEINVPSLLVQPICENAVKHGVSAIKDHGCITICIERVRYDLQISISDNGKGYDISRHTEGFGLKLTRDRIALLNQLNPQTLIAMNTKSGPKGTKVTVNFNYWFL